jgi:hypothetical protein
VQQLAAKEEFLFASSLLGSMRRRRRSPLWCPSFGEVVEVVSTTAAADDWYVFTVNATTMPAEIAATNATVEASENSEATPPETISPAIPVSALSPPRPREGDSLLSGLFVAVDDLVDGLEHPPRCSRGPPPPAKIALGRDAIGPETHDGDGSTSAETAHRGTWVFGAERTPSGSYGGDGNLYAYVRNDPVNLIDPDGQEPLTLTAIALGAWAAVEFGLSVYDAYSTGATLADPEASVGEKLSTVGLFALGTIAPGGGYTAAPKVARGGAAIVRVGQRGEDAVRAACSIGDKMKIAVNGRNRIPDGLTNTVLSEVKNVGSLSYTQQLRDFADFAAQNGRQFDLYVRPTTQLSGPLMDAIRAGHINLRYIP